MEEKLALLCTQMNRYEGRHLFIGVAAQIRAVYKDHEILVTLKRCITLSLSF